MTNTESLTLQDFIEKSDFPEKSKHPLTFLDISRQTSKENVWSAIYAFFFHAEAEHGLGDLFQRSLIDLINESRNEKDDFKTLTDIQTEYSTNDNGRIDLLLKNETQAIIIENKVNHILNNNLDDYWDSVEQPYKRGVVLCLRKIAETKPTHNGFVYIEHSVLLKRVSSSYPLDYETSHRKIFDYLNDFIQNVNNVTKPMDIKNLNFCFTNQKKIHDVTQLNNEYKNHIIKEVENALDIFTNGDERILKLAKAQNDRYRYYECPENPHLSITVIFDGLFNGNNDFAFVVELKYDLIEKAKSITDEELEGLVGIKLKDFFGRKGRWQHYATEKVTVTQENIQRLAPFIAKSLKESESLKLYQLLKEKLVLANLEGTATS